MNAARLARFSLLATLASLPGCASSNSRSLPPDLNELASQDESKGGGEKQDKPVNDGQDVLNPLQRLDTRVRTQQDTGSSGRSIWTLRTDQVFPINRGKWGIYSIRADLPFQWSNAVGMDNANGEWKGGLGDLLIQQIWIKDFALSRAIGASGGGIGLRTVFPTASRDIFGGGQYLLAPLVGAKWDLPSISKGTSLVGAFFYYNDIGSHEDGDFRDKTNELGFSPILNISTRPWGWPIDFVTFYATENILFNFEDGQFSTKESGDFKVPMDITVGKLLHNNRVVVSAQAVWDLYNSNGYGQSDWFFEFRIGFFF